MTLSILNITKEPIDKHHGIIIMAYYSVYVRIYMAINDNIVVTNFKLYSTACIEHIGGSSLYVQILLYLKHVQLLDTRD